MFRNDGGSSVGPWKTQTNNFMDSETLAQTLINTAQTILSNQNRPADNLAFRSPEVSQACPWIDPNQNSVGAWQPQINVFQPAPKVGVGLLGEGPQDMYNGEQFDKSGSTDKSIWSGERNRAEQQSMVSYDSHSDRTYVNAKSQKNYRMKIKESGEPPKYSISEFDHVNSKLFSCDLCGKNMWNSVSFVNHIKGNAHNRQIESLLSEEEEKVEEVKKLIKLKIEEDSKDRGKGRGRKCNMCDVFVNDDLLVHRRTDYHKKLKNFIHPHCSICDADFEIRSEWHYHRFSAEHLTNISHSKESLTYSPIEIKQLNALLRQLEKKCSRKEDVGISKLASKRKNEEDIIIVGEGESTAVSKDKKVEVVGSEFVTPKNAMFCQLCKKFLDNETTLVEEHCQSELHLKMYQEHTKSGEKIDQFKNKRRKC